MLLLTYHLLSCLLPIGAGSVWDAGPWWLVPHHSWGDPSWLVMGPGSGGTFPPLGFLVICRGNLPAPFGILGAGFRQFPSHAPLPYFSAKFIKYPPTTNFARAPGGFLFASVPCGSYQHTRPSRWGQTSGTVQRQKANKHIGGVVP